MNKLAYLVFPGLVLLAACSSSTTPQSDGTLGEHQGKLSLFITDAPLEAEEVVVNFREIAVHKTGGGFETIWTAQDEGGKELDLLKLRTSEELLLDAPLEAGFYTQIRFVIDRGYVVVEGDKCLLEVPSSEVKIVANFEVKDGGLTKLVLDFDAEKSVHVIGAGNKGKNNTKYILRPVIKVKSVSF